MTPFYDLVTTKKVAMVAFIGGRGPKWVGGHKKVREVIYATL